MATWEDVYARMAAGGNDPKASANVWDRGIAKQKFGGWKNQAAAYDAWNSSGRPSMDTFNYQNPVGTPMFPGGGRKAEAAGTARWQQPGWGGPAGQNLDPSGGRMMKPGMGQSGSSPQMLAAVLRGMGGTQRPGMDMSATGGMGSSPMGNGGIAAEMGASPEMGGAMRAGGLWPGLNRRMYAATGGMTPQGMAIPQFQDF